MSISNFFPRSTPSVHCLTLGSKFHLLNDNSLRLIKTVFDWFSVLTTVRKQHDSFACFLIAYTSYNNSPYISLLLPEGGRGKEMYRLVSPPGDRTTAKGASVC